MGSQDIAGYTYKAENMMGETLIERLIAESIASPGARGMSAEDVLDQIAGTNGIDRSDEYSYNSGDFPKPIKVEQLTEDDNEWYRP
ncbi:hypothetical protein [Rhodococcus qingshengii]|uniref:hypothetical protein n=1 Tax=Rhodococcus qingshengii TaxID=334542 RepID=UPI00287FD323|nr:hypothetical protein [Rhodococcus qingshengii]